MQIELDAKEITVMEEALGLMIKMTDRCLKSATYWSLHGDDNADEMAELILKKAECEELLEKILVERIRHDKD